VPSQRPTPTIKDILKSKRRNRISVDIALDPTLKPHIQKLERELRQARRDDQRENRPPQAPQIAKRLEQVEQELEDSIVTLTFEDIGRARFEALIESHPPTDDQIKRHGDSLSWNPETIAPVLIAACSADPEISLEEAEQICEEWSTGDVQLLFNAALQVCLETASVPFTKTAFEETLSFDENSNIVPIEESPTPGS
jgi:hypothetical protein